MEKTMPSPADVRKLLHYIPETGELVWKHRGVPTFDKARAGKTAFTSTMNKGYLQGAVMGVNLLAHRVIWAHYYGEWPDKQIDHINGNKVDNRISNLRVVDPAQNQRNLGHNSANTSGVTGVRFISKFRKWEARIGDAGKPRVLAYTDCFGVALMARIAAMDELGYTRRGMFKTKP